MLTKLLKYECRASGRQILPLCVVMVGWSVIARLLLMLRVSLPWPQIEQLMSGLLIKMCIRDRRLQFAAAVAHTGQTVFVVGREHQLEIGLAGGKDLGGVGEDLHPLVDRIDAGGNQTLGTLDLDDADPAGADLVDLLEVAAVSYTHLKTRLRRCSGSWKI